MDLRSGSAWSDRAVSRQVMGLALLTCLGLALRLFHLGRFELWVDEAATWWFARQVWEGGLSLLQAQEPTPPIYYALVGLWMEWFGESDVSLRLPSALAGAATLPLLFDLGRRLVNRRVGWMAAILLAVHPLHIFYSREARVYALLLMLTVAMFSTLWRAMELDTWRAWGLFAMVLFLICCLHVSGFFLGVTIGLQILFLTKSRRARWRGLLVSALAGLALLPYVLFALPQLEGSRAAWSVESMYEAMPEERRLGRSLEMQLIGADYFVFLRQMDRPPTPQLLRWWALLASLVLLSLALVRGPTPRAGAFLAVAWLISILVPWTLSRTWQVFFHPGRHDVYTLGVVMVLLAMGFDRLLRGEDWPSRWRVWRRPLGIFCAGALLVGGGFRLLALHTQPVTDSYRSKAQWLVEVASAGDAVITTGITRPSLEHYVEQAGGSLPMRSFPSTIEDHMGWSDDRALLEDLPFLQEDAQKIVRSFVEEEEAGRRLFVQLRNYRREGNSASVNWWVDRHLLEALRQGGWRQRDWPRAEAYGMAVFEAAAGASPKRREHGELP